MKRNKHGGKRKLVFKIVWAVATSGFCLGSGEQGVRGCGTLVRVATGGAEFAVTVSCVKTGAMVHCWSVAFGDWWIYGLWWGRGSVGMDSVGSQKCGFDLADWAP